jgi:hypothetical protein
MSYIKQTWVDRAVEFFRRFTYTDDGTHLTLTEAPGTITNAGTPLDSTRLNHMEEGIYDAHENIGDRQYTEENYVVSGETITESVNKLDTNLNLVDTTVASHLAESVTEIISATRDLSVTGVQVIPTTINKPIKSIQAFAEVNNSIKWSQGFADESGLRRSQYLMSNGSYASHDNSLLMISQTMTVDRIYAVPTIGTGTFSLNWIKVGAGATGLLYMNFLITYHGD